VEVFIYTGVNLQGVLYIRMVDLPGGSYLHGAGSIGWLFYRVVLLTGNVVDNHVLYHNYITEKTNVYYIDFIFNFVYNLFTITFSYLFWIKLFYFLSTVVINYG